MDHGLKVAIVHDWLIGGGAERVVHELHKLYPEAPIYTSYATDEWRRRLDGKVVTGYLQKWPFSKLRKFLPVLRIWWFEHLDFSSYDVVISSSGNGEAMGVKTPDNVLHINYCHSPTHYYWRHYDRYMKRPGFGIFSSLARLGLKLLIGPLRRWDYKAAQRPDLFIANSTHIQGDIQKYYGRDSVVIHPPVDVERFNVPEQPIRKGFVTVGRQVPLKHTEIIVKACSNLGLPLTVVGEGPEHNNLVSIAGPSVTFHTGVTDREVPLYMANAEAFLFASYEDFGVTPVEAMAAGTPVVGYKVGGALDYIEPGKTGAFFEDQTAESLAEALQTFDHKDYNANIVRAKAADFSPQHFARRIRELVDKHLTRED